MATPSWGGVNETMLYQLFNEFPVSYIKIAKDHASRESYGYAFVGFKNHSKAEEAVIKLNYMKVLKKSIRLSWYNREPNNYRNMPDFNVFVKKIHKDVKPKEFHDFFSKYGNIISAKLVEDEEGETVGYGFVLYDNAEAAKKAITEGNGFEWKGKKIYCGTFQKSRPKKAPQFNTVYVRNLDKGMSQDEIKKMFSVYGEILSVFIKESDPKMLEKLPEEKRKHIMDHQFAFITFKDPNSASRVVNELPYLKNKNKKHNEEITKIVETTKKMTTELEDRFLYKFAAYLFDDNEKDYSTIISDKTKLAESIQAFKKHLSENDDNYIPKDRTDRIECCQALKKRERLKRLKTLYEKIKKQIREKYKFCNLYIKNLPDTFDDEQLRQLFSKYGEIRSCKSFRKELTPSMIGVKRSVKVYGFVCFQDAGQAREAKNALHGQLVFKNQGKLFVDYFQSKKEREEYLKLKMLNNSQKQFQKGNFVESPFPQMMGQFGTGMRQFPGVFGQNMLRKFPVNGPMGGMGGMPPQQMPFMMNPMNQLPDLSTMDPSTKREFFGERLYQKVSMNPSYGKFSDLHGKIIGIFLDLDENVITRLIQDDQFFNGQVQDTVRQLRERTGA